MFATLRNTQEGRITVGDIDSLLRIKDVDHDKEYIMRCILVLDKEFFDLGQKDARN